MQTQNSIEELIALYKKAVEIRNKEAVEIVSSAILKYAEKEALDSSISKSLELARLLIGSGSQ